MFDHLQTAEHQNFLASWNARAKGGGRGAIGLAAPHVAKALACVGDLCSRYFASDSGLSIKAADLLPTYDGAGFQLETKATSEAGFRALLPEGVEPPKHTLMVLRHIVTTPREDRDEDVLQTAGARVDPAMPLLWQHIIGLPIGRRIATVEHTPEVLRLATSLIDLNDLTADAAKLIEADALRFSHGFRVLEYRERKTEGVGGCTGFEVTKFEILECSLVSVPSNVDAVMEAYAKGGLSSEPMKRFAKGLSEERKVIVGGVELPRGANDKPKLVQPKEKDAAKAIRDEDECGIDEASMKASDEVKEQRDLINQSQLSGSSYRPSRRDAGPAAVKSCGCGGPSAKGIGLAEAKAGRVLSKRNLERLAEVRSDLQEIHDYDGMPRPCKAMCKTAMGVLDEVIREASPAEGEEEKSPATPAVHPHPQPALSPDQKFADAVLAANAAKLLQYRRAIDSAIEADVLSHLSEELAELFGV